MTDKPSYLGLLNAIALGERRAAEYLKVWIATTPNDDVRHQLHTICLREAEHAAAFEKRLDELGYSLIETPDAAQERSLEIAASTTLSDRDKLKALKLHRRPSNSKSDIFEGFFANKDIDPQTGALIGRYIAEERDTGRRFADCYDALG